MWKTVFSNVKPADVDSSSQNFVYLRRNIQLVTIEKEDGTAYDAWKYEELKLSKVEYSQLRISELESENTNLQLALTELYEKLLEG